MRRVRAVECQGDGAMATTVDASGNRVCKYCKKLSTDNSFRNAVHRSETFKRSRSRNERGQAETRRIRNKRKRDFASMSRQSKASKREAQRLKVLENAGKGKINFKKIAKVLRDIGNNTQKNAEQEKEGLEVIPEQDSSEITNKQSTKTCKSAYAHTSSSRELKLTFIADIMNNLGTVDKRGNRFSEKVKNFFTIIRIVGGAQAHRILAHNMGVPANETLRRMDTHPAWEGGFSETNWESIRKTYQSVKAKYPDIMKCLVLSAEDETGIRVAPSWDPRTDTVTGFCGVECTNKCEEVTTCRQKKLCDPVHQCMSEEQVFVVGNDAESYNRIKEICEKYRKGRHLRIMMLNPLDARWPRLVCAHFDTCNAFDAADYVKKQWRRVEDLYRTHIEDIVGPLVGFSSDGDSRRRKLMLHYALGAEAEKLVCFCCDPNSLQRGCVRVRYGLHDEPTFTMKAWKFIIKDKATGETHFRIRYIGDQDSIHCGKKLINCAHHPSRQLRLGPYLYAHMNAITTNMNSQTREETGLLRGDDCRIGWRAMDWPSAIRLMTRKHLTSMDNLCEGRRENQVPNESVRGTMEYLKICRMYTSIYADWSLSHTERIRRAGYVVTYLRLWFCYIDNDPNLTVAENFISREAFQDVLLSCHAAVLLIMANRDLTPWQATNLIRAGTDCCEDFFSFAGASVANKRVFSTLEVRHTIHNHLTVEMLAALGDITIPKSTSHRRQIWDHEGEKVGVEEWQTDAVLKKAWKKGVAQGRKLAQDHGMRPNYYQRVRWWNYPEEICDAKFACARGEGIDDDYWEEEDDDDTDSDDSQNDNTDTDSDDSDNDSGNDEQGLGECLQAIGHENLAENNNSQICQTVMVPGLNQRVHKATVVADLASGGRSDKVSADRMIRVQTEKSNLEKAETEAIRKSNLRKDAWIVGIDTDIAVMVVNDKGETEVEIGRVKRVLRAKKKKTEYRRGIDISSTEDRDKLYKQGVRLYCHFYTRKGKAKKQVYEFTGSSLTTMPIDPHMIVAPVVMEYVKNREWKLNDQSHEIVKNAQKKDSHLLVDE